VTTTAPRFRSLDQLTGAYAGPPPRGFAVVDAADAIAEELHRLRTENAELRARLAELESPKSSEAAEAAEDRSAPDPTPRRAPTIPSQ
jgi:hypothetical protein